jgi:hypothetical protein
MNTRRLACGFALVAIVGVASVDATRIRKVNNP